MTHLNGIGNNSVSSSHLDRADRVQTDQPSKTSAAPASVVSDGKDTATLSGASNVLAQAAATTDDVRTEKVAALKAAVDAGTYSVPSTAVADKLLNSLLE